MTRHFTAREFNHDIAARDGPVIITDRGQPAHVLLSYDEYRRLGGGSPVLAGLFASADTVDLDFETGRRGATSLKPADFG